MTEKRFQCNGFGNAYINAPIEAHEKLSKQLVTCRSPDEPYHRIKGYKHQTHKLKRKTVENKRFTVPDKYQFSHSKVQLNGEPLTNDEIVRVLNVNDGSFVENLNLKKENNELKKRLSHAEKVNIGLIDENHRLRLTLIHSSDLNFDINWLKENLNDWNNKE